MSKNWMDKFLDGFGGAIAAGLQQKFGAPQSDRPAEVAYVSIRPERLEAFRQAFPGAVFGDEALAHMLRRGKEHLIPQIALKIAQAQLEDLEGLVFAVTE